MRKEKERERERVRERDQSKMQAPGDETLSSEMPRALVVPASGQGHIIPCMQLARALAALGFEVSFIYFSSAYAKLQTKKRLHDQPDLNDADTSEGGGLCSAGRGCGRSQRLSIVKIEKGSLHIYVVEDGFAPGDESKPFFSTPAMQENVFILILELRDQGRAPTCLVGDHGAPWTVHVAERAGIPFIVFWTSNVLSYHLMNAIPHLFSQGIFPEKGSSTQLKRKTPLMLDLVPGMPPFSSEIFPSDIRFAEASNPLVSLLCDIALSFKLRERILFNTLSELEPDAFRALTDIGICGYTIGPLLHYEEKQDDIGKYAQIKENAAHLPNEVPECIAWLNTQAESSVIYISFGSQVSISAEDIKELALGLEAYGKPFIWVIRDDLRGGQGLSQMLPDGFLHWTNEKGMIINWAPQAEVLAHKAVGGFLTHCGWNSTLESLYEGVPMLCCPVRAEQWLNSHYICNVWGVGLELNRTHTGGIARRDVEVGLKGLMHEEEGLKSRKKAQEVKELAKNTCVQEGQSFRSLQKFYKDMKELSHKEA